jgi:molybdopterin-containing oxidoreductase family iron-sulfur binding subunit
MSDESLPEGMDRRRFLKVLGVTGAGAAVVSGCSTQRVEKLVPYLVQSEDQVPGIPVWYASTCTECAAGCGLHVKTREGRAIKLEGNPGHPVNAGKLCAHGQSALQGLYNPGRIRGPMARQGDGSFKPVTWDEAVATLAQKLQAAGGKLAVISGAGRGTFSDLLSAWTQAQGGRLVRYRPFDFEPVRQANLLTFGTAELPQYDFAAAKYILSFGADFLESWISPVEYQRGYARSHGYADGQMARHVMLAPRMSLTGLNADEWHALRPGTEAIVALAMAGVILNERSNNPNDANALRGMLAAYTPEKAQQESGIGAEVIRGIAREFASADPGLAVAGGIAAQHRGAIEAAAAVNLLNYVAGYVGRTVKFGADLDGGDGYGAMLELVASLGQGGAQVAIVHEANPAYSLPKAAGFEAAFRKAGFKVSTSLYLDETAALCDLLLPSHHALERWDDLRPRRGVAGLMQPVMEPVFQTMATGDLLLQLAQKVGGPLARFNAPGWEAYLKAEWLKTLGGSDAAWRDALQRGGVYGETPVTPVKLAPGAQSVGYTAPAFDGETGGDSFFLATAPSVMGDGRFANRPWLLELSDPVTKITWHSWVELHPDTAASLNVQDGEIVRLTSPHGSIEAPVCVYPGIHREVVAVRDRAGREPARPGGRQGGEGLPAVPGHPGDHRHDPRLPQARPHRGDRPPARAWHRRRHDAGAGPPGHDAGARGEGGGARGTRGQHPARGRGDRGLPGLGAGVAQARRVRGDQPADVGHGDRSGEVHRLLRLRHRVLRREQHPLGGRGPDLARPGDDLDADRAVLGRRRAR